MRGFRKLHKNRYSKNDKAKNSIQSLSENQGAEIINYDISPYYLPIENDFIANMSKCVGETVTVFVNGGGLSGLGFTGILLSVNNTYIQLITAIGPAPSCAWFNSCTYYRNCTGIIGNKNVGSVTYIPVNKIASFVHNLL